MASFRAVIAKTTIKRFIDVPSQVTDAFVEYAENGRVRVAGTINGYPLYATIIPTKNGEYRLCVNGGMRAAAGVQAGDQVALELHPLRCGWLHLTRDTVGPGGFLTRSGFSMRPEGPEVNSPGREAGVSEGNEGERRRRGTP